MSNSRGVCTLQFSDNYEITDTNEDNEGKCTIAKIKSRDGSQGMTLVKTCIPCNKQEQREFIKKNAQTRTLSPEPENDLGRRLQHRL